mgnify:CR=1 FL=1
MRRRPESSLRREHIFFSCKAMVVYFGVNWGSQLFSVVSSTIRCVLLYSFSHHFRFFVFLSIADFFMYVIFFFTRTENKHSNSSFLRSSKSRLSLSFASLFCNFETCAKIQNFSCFVISAVSILFFLIFFANCKKFQSSHMISFFYCLMFWFTHPW